MSYDLYFYKKKKSDLTESKFAEYLTSNLTSISESDTQWFVENEDTETYFSFVVLVHGHSSSLFRIVFHKSLLQVHCLLLKFQHSDSKSIVQTASGFFET